MINEHQIAQIVNITAQLLEEKDIHSKFNIVGDKTIYAKEGLYVGDFNPSYDFFIKGRGCITGDLIVKGNLFYETTGNNIQQSFSDVFTKMHRPAGFRVRSDDNVRGFMWDQQEDEFVFADEQYFVNVRPRQPIFLQNIRLKNANISNTYTKNLLVDSSIIATNTNNNLSMDSNLLLKGNMRIDGYIYSAQDTVNIKSQLIVKTTKVEGSLFVENVVEVQNNLNCRELRTNNVECSDLMGNNIVLEGELKVNQGMELNGYFQAKKGGEFKQGLEVGGNIFVGKSLIFTGQDSGIAFTNLSHIENASVSFINGKKVDQHGDILTTEGQQELSNKNLGTNLDAKFFKIKNIDNPEDNYDVVNKKYVDQFVMGGHLLEPVRLATNNKLEGVFMGSSYQIISKKMETLMVENVETNIGDRILVKNQENAAENGIYVVISRGHKNQQWILQLAEDCGEIIRNRPRITPLVLVRYGEENGRRLFGMNYMNSTIWEFMAQEDFLKRIWEPMEKIISENKEIKDRLKKLEERLNTGIPSYKSS